MLSPAARHRARRREMLLVLALWLAWQEAPAAPTPAAEDITRGVDWLTKFGYLPPPDPVTGKLQTQEMLTKAITAMQRFGGLKATGVLDEATLELMKTPRCSLPDLATAETRRKRFTQAVTKWGKRNLSWRVRTFPKESHLGHDTVRALMYYALKVWSDITPLNFHEVAGNNADIQIDFSKADHNDGYPFDGPGGTVAHAFFPGDHHTAGDTHFDDDEYWTFRSSDAHGMDLFAVAVHEFGHAIGLTHISAIESIMRPYYQGPVGDPLKYDLPYEDKVRIWQLYGVRESVSPTAKPEVSKTDDHPVLPELPENRSTVPLRRDVPNRCNTHFDAVAQIRGEAFFFKGEELKSDVCTIEVKIEVEPGMSGTATTLHCFFFWDTSSGRFLPSFTFPNAACCASLKDSACAIANRLVSCQQTLAGRVSPGCPAVDKDPIGASSAVRSLRRPDSAGFLSHLSEM